MFRKVYGKTQRICKSYVSAEFSPENIAKVAIGEANLWQQCRDVWAQIKAQAVGGSHFFDINKRLDQKF